MNATKNNPLPPLSGEDYAALKESIARDGFLYPVIVSAGPALQGEIVDGFNRTAIGKELGLEPPRVSRRFDSEAEFRIAQIDANAARRQLTTVQRVQLAMAREPWERKLAEIRRKEAPHKGGSQVPATEKVRATAQAAQAVGLKRDTYEHGKFVLTQAPAEIREQLATGAVSIDRAYRDARRALGLDSRAVVKASTSKRWGRLPAGKYGAIAVTPAWREGAKGFEAGRLIPAEVAALDVRALATRDAVIALVAPARYLREALDVVATDWSARIVTVIVRLRASGVAGAGPLEERAEFAVIGALGKAPLPSLARANVVETDAQFFALLDALVPEAAGIRCFGDVTRAGWTGWNPAIK